MVMLEMVVGIVGMILALSCWGGACEAGDRSWSWPVMFVRIVLIWSSVSVVGSLLCVHVVCDSGVSLAWV